MSETETHQIVTLCNEGCGAIVHQHITVTDIKLDNWTWIGICQINGKTYKVTASHCRVNHWYAKLD